MPYCLLFQWISKRGLFLPFCTSEYLTVHIFDWTVENDTMIWLLIAVMHTITWSCLYGLGHPRQPCSRVTLAELTFHWLLCKIQPKFNRRLRTPLGGETTWVGKLCNPGKRDNFSSCKHFRSPNRNISRYGGCQEIPRLRVWSKNLRQSPDWKLTRHNPPWLNDRRKLIWFFNKCQDFDSACRDIFFTY